VKQNKRFLAFFRFETKRKKKKRFFVSFHLTRSRLEKLKDQPKYFSSFLYKLSQNLNLSLFA
jgi:hypothetical protein